MKTSLSPFDGAKSVLRIQAEAITYRGVTPTASPRILHLDIYTDQVYEFPLVTSVSMAIRGRGAYQLRGHQFMSLDQYLDGQQKSIEFFKTLKIK